MAGFDRLPDSLLLEILAYLEFPNLLATSSVNRRFYRLSQDQRFWKRLDLTNLRFLTLNHLYDLIHRPSAVHVVSLRWEGYLRRNPGFQRVSFRMSTRQAVTPEFLARLNQRCPKLRELHIIYANLDTVTLRDFPPVLDFLGFEGCVVPFDFFGPLNDANILPNLHGLDLNYCHNLSSNSEYSFPGILSRQRLTTLLLTHCFNISTGDLLKVPLQLPNLRTLKVSDLTTVDDDFIRALAETCRSLKQLDISFCHSIKTDGLSLLATSNSCRLEKLSAVETQMDDHILTILAEHQSQLKYLNVVKTKCTEGAIAAFSQSNSGCRVEHRWSATGGKIGAGMWWVDR